MNLYNELQNKMKRQQAVAGEAIDYWIVVANEAIKRHERLEILADGETRFSELLTLRKKMTWLYSRILGTVDFIHGIKSTTLTVDQKIEIGELDNWLKDRKKTNEEINAAITLAERVESIYAEISESRKRFESFARFFELKPIERAVSVMENFDSEKIHGGVEDIREKLDDLLEAITAEAQG